MDLSISELPVATTPLSGSEPTAIVQGGVTKQATTADIAKTYSAGSTLPATEIGYGSAGNLLIGDANFIRLTQGILLRQSPLLASTYINAGWSGATGYNNLAVGAGYSGWVMPAATTGHDNVALGANAMLDATTAMQNVAIGTEALSANVIGHDNVAIGVQSLQNNTGIKNIGVGTLSLQGNITGHDLIGIGYAAGVATGALANSIALGSNTSITMSNQFVVNDAIINWHIGGLDYVIPVAYGASSGYVLTDTDGAGTLAWMTGGGGASGYSGFSGTSGYSGTGLSGFSGISGYSGSNGTSGFSGISGFSGYSGLGVSGFSGASGLSGYSGISGNNGTSGFSGAVGSGFSGYSGFSGHSGYSGANGVGGTTYGDTLIPFGDGATPGGVTDSSLAYNLGAQEFIVGGGDPVMEAYWSNATGSVVLLGDIGGNGNSNVINLNDSTNSITLQSPSGIITLAGSQVQVTNSMLGINGVSYAWPASQGAAYSTMTDDGSGNLSWAYGLQLNFAGSQYYLGDWEGDNNSTAIIINDATAGGSTIAINAGRGVTITTAVFTTDTISGSTIATAPAPTPNSAGAGSGATANITGTNIGGLISVTTGTVSGFGDIVDVTYGVTFINGTSVILTPADATTATLGAIIYAAGTASGFSISCISILASGTTYNWNYVIIGQ